jgi:hypothetical protein
METKPLGLILIDAPDDDNRAFDTDLFERWGHSVEVCAGPAADELCPLLGGRGCSKYDAAHGIIVKLDLDREQHRAIVERYRELGPYDLPIRILCTPEQARFYSPWLMDFEVWDHEPTTADLEGFAAEVESVDR